MLSNSFKWKHHEEIILLNVRWYLKYPLSYRNLKGMTIKRGIQVDHSTIMRWVHQYSPEMEMEFIVFQIRFRIILVLRRLSLYKSNVLTIKFFHTVCPNKIFLHI